MHEMIVQLSLMDFFEEEKPQYITTDDGVLLPATITRPLPGWADGDCSPRALQRLSRVTIGESFIRLYGPPVTAKIDIHTSPDYRRYVYRCVSCEIVGDIVMATYTYEYRLRSSREEAA